MKRAQGAVASKIFGAKLRGAGSEKASLLLVIVSFRTPPQSRVREWEVLNRGYEQHFLPFCLRPWANRDAFPLPRHPMPPKLLRLIGAHVPGSKPGWTLAARTANW